MSTPTALPGSTPTALPGSTPTALPGATLGCDLTFEADQANCTIAINTNVPAVSDPTTPASLLPGLHPADLQNRYALPVKRAGGTVAIVDAYDDPVAESDLAVYRTAYGLPPCTSSNGCFTKLNEQGQPAAYPSANAGWDEEISLDLDMVSAACPNCKIVLVEASSPSFDDLGAAVDMASSLHPIAISNSYYGPEWPGETAYDVHYDHPGIAMTVSGGDQQSTFYPAVSPYVTSVGGTSLSGSSGAWNESAWSYTAQGCSAYEVKPAWQSKNGCKESRSMNDMSAVADPQTGVSMYDSTAGGWLVAGGTSVAAPLIAAAYALSGNPQGPSYSYSHRSAFHDIPPVGYDWPTGLGSPNGVGGL
jgi:subtilase family serine protease